MSVFVPSNLPIILISINYFLWMCINILINFFYKFFIPISAFTQNECSWRFILFNFSHIVKYRNYCTNRTLYLLKIHAMDPYLILITIIVHHNSINLSKNFFKQSSSLIHLIKFQQKISFKIPFLAYFPNKNFILDNS